MSIPVHAPLQHLAYPKPVVFRFPLSFSIKIRTHIHYLIWHASKIALHSNPSSVSARSSAEIVILDHGVISLWSQRTTVDVKGVELPWTSARTETGR
jgi:hypothetical protein